VLLLLALLLGVSACGSNGEDTSAGGSSTPAAQNGDAKASTVRLGYFGNVTHAPALVGVEKGFFADKLGDTKLETSTFNAGPEAVEALFADALDITFIGPNPAINAYAQSNGEAIRIVAGSTSGGAYLITKPDITSPADLKGKTLATPQLGNTQDVALRAWLKDNDLSSDTSGGGDVSVKPQENADTLNAFKDGSIDGAWVPEPWATRLLQEGGGKVLVDEKTLWPEGKYVTTHVIVRTKFLEQYPGTVKAIIEGELEALDYMAQNPDDAKATTNSAIEKITQKALPQQVIDAAWPNLLFTYDPVASSLQKSASDAEAVGLLDPVDLDGIYDLSLLNAVLAAQSKPEVQGL
jgi:NitT/TauT family transport system substrate-binding protein